MPARRRTRCVAALALVGAIAGCSDASDSSTAQAIPDDAPTTSVDAPNGTSGVASQTLAERTEVIAGCMQDAGLAVEFVVGGGGPGMDYDNRVVSQELFDQTFAECEGSLIREGRIGQPPRADRGYLEAAFSRLTSAASCLRDAGYEVTEPPSEDAWIESRGAAWNPYDSIYETNGVEAGDDAFALCGGQ